MRGNPRLRTPPLHSQCLCRNWRHSRSRVSSEQSTGVVGDWVTRRREGRESERRIQRKESKGGRERRG